MRGVSSGFGRPLQTGSLTLSFNSVLFPRQKIPVLMNTLNTTNATGARRQRNYKVNLFDE